MGVNSIRSQLDRDDIISTIRLALTASTEIHVVVEGEDDVKLLNGKLSRSVDLYESFSGKLGVIEIIEHFQNKSRVIGICDNDYDEYENERIFYYDYNCCESMMISSSRAFNSLCDEYYGSTDNPTLFLTTVLQRLKFLGLLRKYNSIYRWCIRFKGLAINRIFSPHDSSDERNSVLEALDLLNDSKATERYNSNKQEIDTEYSHTSGALLDIVSGHDLVALLSVYFSVKHSGQAKIKHIEGHLRCAYQMADFKQSSLYSMIKHYGIVNNLAIVSST